MGNRGGRQTTWRRRLRTGAALAVAVAASGGGLLAPPAEAGFLRTHRSDSAASTQPNDFKQMLITASAPARSPGGHRSPRTGSPTSSGSPTARSTGSFPGSTGSSSGRPGSPPTGGSRTARAARPTPATSPLIFQQGPSPTRRRSRSSSGRRGSGRSSARSPSTAEPARTTPTRSSAPIRRSTIAVGKITSTQDAIVQLLSDDSFALWPIASNGTGLRDPGSYMAAPTGTHICGGHILLADIAGNSLPDIIQYGDRCGGGDSGIEVWVGNTGPADYGSRGTTRSAPDSSRCRSPISTATATTTWR